MYISPVYLAIFAIVFVAVALVFILRDGGMWIYNTRKELVEMRKENTLLKEQLAKMQAGDHERTQGMVTAYWRTIDNHRILSNTELQLSLKRAWLESPRDTRNIIKAFVEEQKEGVE